jgi:O-antigen ligase
MPCGKVEALKINPMLTLTRMATGLRLFVICLVAASVSLPMAWVSLGKLLLFVTCLIFLCLVLLRGTRDAAVRELWTVRAVLLILCAFAMSLIWTEAPIDIALLALNKHSKLLEIAMLVVLIRNARDARIAMLAFFASQAFFVLSSWVMATGFRVPWATSALHPQYQYVVYSTYLDQTLMFSAAAAMFWHLRRDWDSTAWLAVVLAFAAVTNNLFLQEGKTGYIATLVILTLMIMWEIPKRWRLAVFVLAPTMIGIAMYAGSSKFQGKVTQIVTESQNYSAQGNNASSSGFRLHAWRRSLEAIAEQPLTGHGVGSWTQSVKRIEGADANKVFGDGASSNPHQEFLLWGVELGVGGILLLLLLVAALMQDALRFDTPVRRATLSVMAVMLVACLFNSSLYDALIGDFFCVSLGLLLALGIRGNASGASRAGFNMRIRA